MEYNYLVTYKARKNKEDKEINSTIPIILDCPIYQPEVLMHVNEAIKDLHRYDDIMLMNVEVLNLENEEMKAECENPFYCTCGEEKEEKEQEKEEILSAISQHRTDGSDNGLAMLLYKADKKSRNCFSCSAASECYWPSEKKNLTIEY